MRRLRRSAKKKRQDVELSRTLCFACIVALLGACSYFVSWNDSVEGGVGRPIVDIQKTWGAPDEIREVHKGEKEYVYRLKRLDPSCVHYWIVDQRGVITGYHYEGRCRPIG